jgi:hypothetical protein
VEVREELWFDAKHAGLEGHGRACITFSPDETAGQVVRALAEVYRLSIVDMRFAYDGAPIDDCALGQFLEEGADTTHRLAVYTTRPGAPRAPRARSE